MDDNTIADELNNIISRNNIPEEFFPSVLVKSRIFDEIKELLMKKKDAQDVSTESVTFTTRNVA